METLEAEAHKFAKAGLKQHLSDEASVAAALRQTAATEMVEKSRCVYDRHRSPLVQIKQALR